MVLACTFCALVSLSAVGCAKKGSGVEEALVVQQEMPEGGDFSGVYYDSYFGNLHLVREGDRVTGKWRTDSGDAWGELAGDVKGNLLRFEWTEHKIGMVGASATTKGKGYFNYKRPDKPGDPDFIEGQRGMGNKQTGQKWKGVKQHNVPPNPASVVPDEFEARGQGGGWDEDESKSSRGRASSKSSSDESESSSSSSSEEREERKAPPPKKKSGDNEDTDY
jgi:hypothetical protein